MATQAGTDTQTRIAAGLERAFAEGGFAEVGVDALREATQVSLRTLYKYFPSREAMVLAALEHRHERYLRHLLDDLPADPAAALDALFDRGAEWMRNNAPQGCLFHGAVAAQPDSAPVLEMLTRHKRDLSDGMARATGLPGETLLLLHEGVTQCWRLMGAEAAERAKALARPLLQERR